MKDLSSRYVEGIVKEEIKAAPFSGPCICLTEFSQGSTRKNHLFSRTANTLEALINTIAYPLEDAIIQVFLSLIELEMTPGKRGVFFMVLQLFIMVRRTMRLS